MKIKFKNDVREIIRKIAEPHIREVSRGDYDPGRGYYLEIKIQDKMIILFRRFGIADIFNLALYYNIGDDLLLHLLEKYENKIQ